MTLPARDKVTAYLKAWNGGRDAAPDGLMQLVYDELRHIASAYMKRERPGHTLQVTGLVHEAYLRLLDQRRVVWQDRRHFYGIAAQSMRRVLIDHARQKAADKRGGGIVFVEFDEALVPVETRGIDPLALDEALTELGKLDERQRDIVELRFFGGLSIADTAKVLDVSPSTVKRDWEIVRVWLTRQLARP